MNDKFNGPDREDRLREHLLSKPEVARYMRVTPRTIDNHMARGLPHYKLGSRRVRFKLTEVETWLRERCHVVRSV